MGHPGVSTGYSHNEKSIQGFNDCTNKNGTASNDFASNHRYCSYHRCLEGDHDHDDHRQEEQEELCKMQGFEPPRHVETQSEANVIGPRLAVPTTDAVLVASVGGGCAGCTDLRFHFAPPHRPQRDRLPEHVSLRFARLTSEHPVRAKRILHATILSWATNWHLQDSSNSLMAWSNRTKT